MRRDLLLLQKKSAAFQIKYADATLSGADRVGSCGAGVDAGQVRLSRGAVRAPEDGVAG